MFITLWLIEQVTELSVQLVQAAHEVAHGTHMLLEEITGPAASDLIITRSDWGCGGDGACG